MNGEGTGETAPPWAWAGLKEAEWLKELDELGQWVDRLQQCYRWVHLEPCWPAHEGLRRELDAFRWWWLELHLSRSVDEPQVPSAEGLVRWHSALRAAASAWQQVYGRCAHRGAFEIDELQRPLEELAGQRERYAASAWEGTSRRRE